MASYVYILASQRKGTLYVGVTSNIVQRMSEHKLGIKCNFTKRHNIKLLVYYEVYEDIQIAIQREKILKRWRRDWKIALIEKDNPWWHDRFSDITGEGWTMTSALDPA
jgi:putative endonuclease